MRFSGKGRNYYFIVALEIMLLALITVAIVFALTFVL
jgi:hypothetical protein